MKILPSGLNVKGKVCVVVGAGKSASAAARELACAGARVRVVATRAPRGCALPGDAERTQGRYGKRCLKGAALVVAASTAKVNAAVERDAKKAGVRVIAASRDAAQKVRGKAGANRGSAEGGAERLVRDQTILSLFGDEYTHLASIIAAVRTRAMKGIPNARRRRAFLEALADDAFLDIIRKDGCKQALAAAERMLESAICARDA